MIVIWKYVISYSVVSFETNYLIIESMWNLVSLFIYLSPSSGNLTHLQNALNRVYKKFDKALWRVGKKIQTKKKRIKEC